MQNQIKKALEDINGPFAGMKIKSFDSVSGGCIHQAWKISLEDGRIFFAKTNASDSFPMFEYESEGLNYLHKFADSKYLIIPQVIEKRKYDSFSLLLMPWLSLTGNDQRLLGKGLAALHKNSAKFSSGSFGWESDGFIGSGNQRSGWREKWGECFYDLRLLPQLKLAVDWGLNITSIETIRFSLIDFLNNHDPMPSIVHGDLWSGNSFIQSDGKGVLLDPAVWWADREVDIAMTKLFGGFSEDFYTAYEKEWPLSKDFKSRVDIYNFYHLLNHANIFGGSYKKECISFLKKLIHSFAV